MVVSSIFDQHCSQKTPDHLLEDENSTAYLKYPEDQETPLNRNNKNTCMSNR